MTAEIHILCVGKGAQDPAATLAGRYLERLPVPVRLKEIGARGGARVPERRRREGDRLRARIPRGAFVIALDEDGRSFSSAAFAAALARWQEEGRPLAFLIGGADGLDPELRAAADLRLSLSSMTWPHMLVRAMLAEQLYRAFSILKGHPYHR